LNLRFGSGRGPLNEEGTLFRKMPDGLTVAGVLGECLDAGEIGG
jgi:hypothetical protein